MSNKVLILFAHPRFERSANNAFLIKHIPQIPEITFHDLYEKYPDFNIDIEYEKKLLAEHQVIIFQHPFYWYSAPPLMKQWIDLVLQFGWAYGPAAVVCVPIAKRLGMGSVLGYLLAGMLIGSFVLGFIGKEGEDIMHFAEFGVVMMLFLIGLELEPSQFWKMRKSIAGMGSMQMILTSLFVFVMMIFLNLSWQISLAIALAFAMSSTAIVLQAISEKGLSQTTAGQASFSVLLFQDIMVIPVLALLPLLAIKGLSESSAIDSIILGSMPGWLQGLAFFAAVALIYLGGRYLFVPLLRIVAKTGLRELFTASSLLLVIAVSLLMQLIGLSHDMKQYVMKARETFKLQEELLAQDLAHDIDENDHSWDSERIREVIANLK